MGERYRRARTLLLLLLLFFFFVLHISQTDQRGAKAPRPARGSGGTWEGGRERFGVRLFTLDSRASSFFYLILLRKFEFFQPAGVKNVTLGN